MNKKYSSCRGFLRGKLEKYEKICYYLISYFHICKEWSWKKANINNGLKEEI